MGAETVDSTDRATPFSNGCEFMDWLAGNCDICRMAREPNACEIEEELAAGCGMDGTMDRGIAARGGLDRKPYPARRCLAFQPIGTHDDSVAVIRSAPGQLAMFDEVPAESPS